jgi:hypothetical protein
MAGLVPVIHVGPSRDMERVIERVSCPSPIACSTWMAGTEAGHDDLVCAGDVSMP